MISSVWTDASLLFVPTKTYKSIAFESKYDFGSKAVLLTFIHPTVFGYQKDHSPTKAATRTPLLAAMIS